MKSFISFSLILSLIFSTYELFGQVEPDSSKLCKIEIIDGNEFLGLVVSEDSLYVELETSALGKLNIPKATIKKMTWVQPSNVKAGKFWDENPQSSRYFWAPNGFGLKKGEGYYQNIWVLWNQASVGLTDYFSIGAGTIPLFFFGGAPTPVWLVPKFSIPVSKDKFCLGAGALAGTLLGEGGGFGILYGLGTIGNRNKNITFGIGYGFAEGEWASSPLFTLSGMARLGAKGYFISENYFISTSDGNVLILSAGARNMIKKVGLDYGLFMPLASEMETFIAIPWLGFTVPLGNK